MADTEYICLDTEFVNNVSIIELSVFSIADREIYHELYSPDKRVRWTAPPDKLKITPEMLVGKPTFPQRREEVQKIIDGCRYIIGYALDNDISMLRKCGISGIDDKKAVEVRELYWLCVGNAAGMDINSVPNLIAITNELGMTFADGEAHFATSDTRATLFCFHKLMGMFAESEGMEYDESAPDEAIERFYQAFAKAKEAFLRERAKGYVCLFATEEGLRFKVLREKPAEETVACVAVADRTLAEYELTKRFERKLVGESRFLMKLDRKDIAYVERYENEFDEERSRTVRKLMKLRKKYNN